jgi:hypothetical protein
MLLLLRLPPLLMIIPPRLPLLLLQLLPEPPLLLMLAPLAAIIALCSCTAAVPDASE